jgi:hypothetical protein
MCLTCFACVKEKYANVKLIAHAGSGLGNPKSAFHDNSEEGVYNSLAYDACDGVELDIQMDAEGKLWCYHDGLLDSKTNYSGCIPALVSSMGESIKYSFPSNEKLFRLDRMNFSKWHQEALFLDMRSYAECLKLPVNVSKVVASFNAINFFNQASIDAIAIVSDSSWINAFDTLNCKVFVECYSFTEANSYLNDIRVEGVVLRTKLVSKEQVSALKKSKEVVLYEVRAAKPTRLALAKNPNYLLTDDLEIAINEKY